MKILKLWLISEPERIRLVGAVMKKTKGRADARTAREMLLEKLGK